MLFCGLEGGSQGALLGERSRSARIARATSNRKDPQRASALRAKRASAAALWGRGMRETVRERSDVRFSHVSFNNPDVRA